MVTWLIMSKYTHSVLFIIWAIYTYAPVNAATENIEIMWKNERTKKRAKLKAAECNLENFVHKQQVEYIRYSRIMS